MTPRAHRLGTLALVGLAVGVLAAVQVLYFQRGIVPGDAFVYLAAGERLNAGADLYALAPGDRPVDVGGEYWNVPLVSPPPIAVLWRPLAALPNELGVWLWYGAQFAALATALVLLGRRAPARTALALVLLVFPTAYEIGVGNVNSFLLLGLLATWRTAVRDAPMAGVLSAAMTVVKLTPAVIAWWLVVTGRRRAVLAGLASGLVLLSVSILGAGWPAHVEYLRILGDRAAVGVSPLSVGGWGRYVGLPAAVYEVLPTLCAIVGVAIVWVLRHRPAAAFRVAVVTMILGSPAVSINWFVLLYALLAPTAWPLPESGGQAPASGDRRTQPSSPAYTTDQPAS